MEKKDAYAIGWHEGWEVYLHHIRYEAKEANKPLTAKDELQMLSAWQEKNKKTAYELVPCDLCQEQISNMVLHNKDPFLCPPEVKATLCRHRIKGIKR